MSSEKEFHDSMVSASLLVTAQRIIDAKDKEIERLKSDNKLTISTLSHAHLYLVSTYDIYTWKEEPEYAMMKDFEQVLKRVKGVVSE